MTSSVSAKPIRSIVILMIIEEYFCQFSIKTKAMGTHLEHHVEMLLMGTHNLRLYEKMFL